LRRSPIGWPVRSIYLFFKRAKVLQNIEAMPVAKGDVLKVEIEKLVSGGRGIARVDGLAVFVDRVVPGDEVRVKVVRRKKNYAEARIVDLLRPSAFRVKAPCSYSGTCGGCPWQFIAYEKQLSYKREHIMDALEHIGRIKGVQVHPPVASPKQFGYRNKMEFSFSDSRWRLPEELSAGNIREDFALGLHVPGTFDKVLDIDTCLLQPNLGNSILADVRSYVRKSGIPPYGLKSHKGFWRFLMLRHSFHYDTWLVNIVTSREERSWVQPLADTLYEKYQEVVSIVNNVNTRRAAIALGEYEILLAGEPFIKEKIGRFEFTISANSFFQTNTDCARRLYEIVRDYSGLTGREVVLDLYSGTGTVPICLSSRAKKIIGIEISENAVRDAQKNCQKNQIENCLFICGDIKAGLKHLQDKPDVMVVDPPRAGMPPDVIKLIGGLSPSSIIYVSCNPATMARDLAMLKQNYHVLEIQPVDMFPHTPHIESVARLELTK